MTQQPDRPNLFDAHFHTLITIPSIPAPYSAMSTNCTTASFYSNSAITMESPIFDAEVQRLIDELDHLDNFITLDSLFCGAQKQFDSFALPADDESYLSLYDLCGGDPTLVDTIRRADSASSIDSPATPPLSPATPTVEAFDFPAPTVGGKWVPGFHASLVPTFSYRMYAPIAPPAPLTVPTPRPATPDPTPAPAPASPRAGPSRSTGATHNIRYQPYRKAAPAKREAPGSIKKKKSVGRAGRIETRDYLAAHPVSIEDLTRVAGSRALIREGRWGCIIMDAIRQIGVPYPTRGLQELLAELYDGEGAQEGIAKGVKGRPPFPWRVSLKALSFL